MTGPLLPQFSMAGVMSVVRDPASAGAGPRDDDTQDGDEFIAAVLARLARLLTAVTVYDHAIADGQTPDILTAGDELDAAIDEVPMDGVVAFAAAVLVYAQPPWDETIIGTRIAEAAAQHLGRGDTRAVPLLPGGAS